MPISAKPRRSVLFLPAGNPRAVEKARISDCDVVVLDLEDATAPEQKAQARADALAAIRAGGFGHRELVVRANHLSTPWGADDLAALKDSGVAAIVIPKVSTPRELKDCAALTGNARLWAMIETCQAVLELGPIAAAAADARCDMLVVGVNDLSKDMRCRPGPERTPLIPALALTVCAARAYGLMVVDGVYNSLDDADGLARECRQGADFGFDGKSLIHPNQAAAANAAFRPDEKAIARAQTIIAAFDLPENHGKGVISLKGRMVERLHLEEARRLIAVEDSIAAYEGST
jgi:citrate lyase subunit beta/citryl-CoA lyase